MRFLTLKEMSEEWVKTYGPPIVIEQLDRLLGYVEQRTKDEQLERVNKARAVLKVI